MGQINEQQLNEELRELVRPALAARVESLIEELGQDDELWENLCERFEELDLHGCYPALREHLSALSDEQKDAFLKKAGMEAMRSLAPPGRQPWNLPFWATCMRIENIYTEEMSTTMRMNCLILLRSG